MRPSIIFMLAGTSMGQAFNDENPLKQFMDNNPIGMMIKAGQEHMKSQVKKNVDMMWDQAWKGMPKDAEEESFASAPAPSFVEQRSVERCASFDCPAEFKMRKGYAALECGKDCMTTCCKPCSGSCWKKHVALVQKKEKRRRDEALTEALEEKVARLEARVKELEENGAASSQVEAPSMMTWLGKMFQNNEESDNSDISSQEAEEVREDAEDLEEQVVEQEESEDGAVSKTSEKSSVKLHRSEDPDEDALQAPVVEKSNLHPFTDFVTQVANDIKALKEDQKQGHKLNMNRMKQEEKRLRPIKQQIDRWAR